MFEAPALQQSSRPFVTRPQPETTFNKEITMPRIESDRQADYTRNGRAKGNGAPSIFNEQTLQRMRKADETNAASSDPIPNPADDYRSLATALSFLAHDTPERKALLKAAGLGTDSLSPRQCRSLSGNVLRILDGEEASLCFGTPWDKQSFPSRNEEPPRFGFNTERMSDVIPEQVEWLWSST
jgi:hypothetical protein